MTAAQQTAMKAAWKNAFDLAGHDAEEVNFNMSRVSSIIWVAINNNRPISSKRIARMMAIATA
jgi:pyruvoyl-dependent arginine decarboxylase (PvlArgDC)